MATTTTPSSPSPANPPGLPSPSLSTDTRTNKQPSDDPASSPSRTARQKPKRSLRILCFGDSLTSGYSQLGSVSHPYSQRLTAVLSESFPSLNIDAHADGLPGDVVCTAGSRFLRRIEPKFLTKGGGTPYDWTVILGGTNDLAFQFTAEDIYKALRDVWDVALSKGGRVLACTVPEAGIRGQIGQRVKARRDELNELILGHRQENFFTFDLNTAIPFWSLAPEERKTYWDDHIHLTPAGYDLMGEKIAARLVEIIMPPGRLQPQQVNGAGTTRRRKIFRDDDKVFEEEDGDEHKLEHGYYVVRRKDLE
ncbi:SGNH hydrolase-type esterase domain-containing protein [Diaporthe sp. PMI_573]|nr:SGNH hydrolase-type esterase domain-containing protein [Diaporthaceae sp. PMI_573]